MAGGRGSPLCTLDRDQQSAPRPRRTLHPGPSQLTPTVLKPERTALPLHLLRPAPRECRARARAAPELDAEGAPTGSSSLHHTVKRRFAEFHALRKQLARDPVTVSTTRTGGMLLAHTTAVLDTRSSTPAPHTVFTCCVCKQAKTAWKAQVEIVDFPEKKVLKKKTSDTEAERVACFNTWLNVILSQEGVRLHRLPPSHGNAQAFAHAPQRCTPPPVLTPPQCSHLDLKICP